MTLPTSDAQSSRSLPRRPLIIPPTHSIYADSSQPQGPFVPQSTLPVTPPRSATGSLDKLVHEHALDFATHSWDLATDGLKTLTAKRELFPRPGRRVADVVPEALPHSRSYTFILTILVCVVLMLIGGGVVLFVMLQP